MSIGPWNAAITAAAHAAQAKSCQTEAVYERRGCGNPPVLLCTTSLKSPGPKRSSAGKCPGCGSHSFVAANNVRICAYCRTPRTEESP